jgi:hypothetical protein
MDFFRNLLDTSDFLARWQSGNWSPSLGWLYIVSDLCIFLAYFAIPAALAIILVRRRDVPFGLLLSLSVAFLLACGATHLLDAVIFWKPVYRLAGLVKAVTAVVSVVTAIVMVRSLPWLLALPDVQAVNDQLRAALAREERTREELSEARTALERRSSEMTQRLRRKTAALAGARAVACRWEVESGRVDWQIGFVESCRQGSRAFPTRCDSRPSATCSPRQTPPGFVRPCARPPPAGSTSSSRATSPSGTGVGFDSAPRPNRPSTGNPAT